MARASDILTKEVDLRNFRVTADATNLYLFLHVEAATALTGPNAVEFQVGIDDGTGANTALIDADATTPVSTTVAAPWKYLAQTRFKSGAIAGTTSSAAPRVYTDPTTFSTAGTGGVLKGVGIDTAELKIPWVLVGGAPPAAGKRLRFTVATMYSSRAAPLSPDGVPSSRVMDTMHPTQSAAADLANDQLDYFLDVYFDAQGEVFSPLLISEFQPNAVGPDNTSAQDTEWIEIYNASAFTIDLSGYKVGDAARRLPAGGEGMFKFPPGATIAPGGIAVAANSKSMFNTVYPTVAGLPNVKVYGVGVAATDLTKYAAWAGGSIFTLLDGPSAGATSFEEQVVLLDGGDSIVDIATYASATLPIAGAYPGVVPLTFAGNLIPESRSYERCPAARDTNDVAFDFITHEGKPAQTPGMICDGTTTLSLAKTAPASVAVGGRIDYTLTYQNSGASDTSVYITDTLPANLTYIAGSQSASPAQFSDLGGGVLQWRLPRVSAGTGVISFSAQAAAADVLVGQTITNTAVIAGQLPDSDPADNTATAATLLTQQPQADLGIAKTLISSPSTFYSGRPAVYTLSYSNTGDLPAAHTLITDTIPAGLSFIAASRAPASSDSAHVVFDVGTVASAVDATIVLTFTVTAPPVGGTTITNSAAIGASTLDQNEANNSASASATTAAAPPPDLALTKSADSTSVALGGAITYQFTITNLGGQAASGVHADINTTGGGPFTPNNSSSPRGLTAAGGTLFFSADDGTRGRELWRSDGTDSGTKIVKNIAPGVASSAPGELTDLNGTLLFTATSVLSGTELWKSDGSSAGTVVVQDIDPAPGASSYPADLTLSNGALFFSADDGTAGRELWKADGGASGAGMVKDIFSAPGAASNPTDLTDVNGTLFFAATGALSDTELWKSDGSSAGTVQVADINTGLVGPPSANPAQLTNVNGALFFRADDGLSGVELWKSDGTITGTVQIKDINSAFPGAASTPDHLTNVHGTLFFAANDGVHGVELWQSDGTITGTLMLKDIHLGAGDSSPANLTNVHGTLFFTANDGIGGVELWQSDGTPAGTSLVKDIYPGAADSSPSGLAIVSGTLLFSANDGASGRELWKSRGTAATTVLVQNIAPGASDSDPASFVLMGTQVFFSASDDTAGRELWSIATDALNYAPTASNQTIATPLDTPANGTLSASDPEGSPLTFSLVTNGSKGVAAIANPATGAFTYTPNAAAAGNDTFTFQASDGLAASNVATVTVTIGNHPPVASDAAIQTPLGTPFSGTLSASDADGNALTFSLVANGAKGVAAITNLATGAFTYTPNAGASGGDSFTFKVSDGLVDSNVATVTVTIGAPNQPPVANGATIRTTLNRAISGVLSASDADGDALTFSLVANGSKGVVVITNPATGAFTYAPNAGARGGDSFTFKVSDGQADSNVAVVNITIDQATIYMPIVRR